MPWIAVTKRFKSLHENLKLTEAQVQEGADHHHGVRKALNANYYNSTSESQNSFLTGSWGKFCRTRPPRDIDLYFRLPIEVFEKFEKSTGNQQSQLLQEVRGVLKNTYPSTEIKGDGPVVVVGFNRLSVEVVPCFELSDGKYAICDTRNGGQYVKADPKAEIQQISTVHQACNNNLRPMIMMLKAWQSYCNVPIKSFYLELLATEFFGSYAHRLQTYFYYDWFIRDFLEYLISKAHHYVYAPGTYEAMNIGDSWKSRAETAYNRAKKACDNEHMDYVLSAGEEWQKIFGTDIPLNPT